MLFLILTILSSTAVLIVFKFINQYKVNTFSAIIVNYFTACSAGFFLGNNSTPSFQIVHSDWFFLSLILGVIFISMFNVMGLCIKKTGVTTTAVAAKMSVIIPILFSIFIEASDILTPLKSVGIAIALTAVFMATYRKEQSRVDRKAILLPMILFFGIGILDSLVKYAQYRYVSEDTNSLFSGTTFCIAGITGLIILVFYSEAARHLAKIKTWIFGILLGLTNFGSMYFMISALNTVNVKTGEHYDSSVLFGINNIGIVVLGILIGYLFFRERPTKFNWIGIALSMLAIVILSFS